MALHTGMVRAHAPPCRASCVLLVATTSHSRARAHPRSTQLHPNPNLKNPDPTVDLNIVVGGTALKHPVRAHAARGESAQPRARVHAFQFRGLFLRADERRGCPSQVDVALSNSFGFGGHNSCILFSAFKQ
jgi:hypothetical protein